MTDIKQAIAELREAIEDGTTWAPVWQKLEYVATAIRNHYLRCPQMDALDTLRVKLSMATRPNAAEVITALTALESSVEGGTVDGNLIDARPVHKFLDMWMDQPNDTIPDWSLIIDLAKAVGRWVQYDGYAKMIPVPLDRSDRDGTYDIKLPSLTSRIEAAAEEIADKVWTDTVKVYGQDDAFVVVYVADIAAIIRRHLEVK